MAGKVKIMIDLTKSEVTSDYVFETLFKISKKSSTIDFKHAEIAKEIVKLALKRGDDGFFVVDWKEIMKEKGITHSQYFSILRTLKAAGILRKSQGKYYALFDFADHLGKMSAAINLFYQEHGKVRK